MQTEQEDKLYKVTIGLLIVGLIAVAALILGILLPNKTVDDAITYNKISPYIHDYLDRNNLLTGEGTLPVPSTGGDEELTISVGDAIEQLLRDGKLDYLKGAKGDTGERGATGAQGAQGIPGSYAGKGDKGDKGDTGATGADGQDGLITATDSTFVVSGGTLSLKPCALSQVLMYSSSATWDCATVTAGGIGSTTNVSATLTLSGTRLTASITDSDGNTVSSSPLDLDPTFATDAELAAIDLSSYVTTASLGTTLGDYYKRSELYTKTELDNLLADKQESLPACTTGQVVKYDTTSSSWLCATDNAGSGATDLTGYATEAWVSQNYATKTALSSLLVSNLVEGTGVTLENNNGVITINATGATNVFEVVSDHTTVATPDSNRIYIDTATNPDSQWVYHNGAWQQVGEVNADLANYYTKTQTDTAISTAITSNNANYTTTSDLTSLLAAKQDKLPTCAAGQVVKYSLTAPNWVCAADADTTYNLSSYATQTWVGSQNFATTAALANYYTKTEADALLGNKITGIGGVTKIEMVTTMPATQDPNTVYMLVEP